MGSSSQAAQVLEVEKASSVAGPQSQNQLPATATCGTVAVSTCPLQAERNRACKHVQAVRGAFAVQREKLVSLRKEAKTLNRAIKVLEVGDYNCKF